MQSQTTTSTSPTLTQAAVDRFCYRALSAAVWLGVKAARLARLLPPGVDWFVSEAVRPGWDCWREDQETPRYRNFIAVMGKFEVTISWPRPA